MVLKKVQRLIDVKKKGSLAMISISSSATRKAFASSFTLKNFK